jgi:hypothetical protein
VGAPFQGLQTRVGIDFAMPAEQCYQDHAAARLE